MTKGAAMDRIGTAERLLAGALEHWDGDATRAKASVEVALAELRLEQAAKAAAITSDLVDWNLVRAFFVARGDTVRKWSVRNGYHPAYVELSGTGKRRGPKAGRIVADLKRETGL
jgi:hypothetical protein